VHFRLRVQRAQRVNEGYRAQRARVGSKGSKGVRGFKGLNGCHMCVCGGVSSDRHMYGGREASIARPAGTLYDAQWSVVIHVDLTHPYSPP